MQIKLPPELFSEFARRAAVHGLSPEALARGLIRTWTTAEALSAPGDGWGVTFAPPGRLPEGAFLL